MLDRVVHATLANRPAVLLYTTDNTVRGYHHDGLTWREIDRHVIVDEATILTARAYAARWPGLKLPTAIAVSPVKPLAIIQLRG